VTRGQDLGRISISEHHAGHVGLHDEHPAMRPEQGSHVGEDGAGAGAVMQIPDHHGGRRTRRQASAGHLPARSGPLGQQRQERLSAG
jgi:hypothetical protein